MNAIRVGDRVRSFDFPSDNGKWGFALEGEDERACYAEGFVLEIDPDWSGACGAYPAYKIGCYKDVGAGKERVGEFSRKGLFVYAPVNGVEKAFGGVCNGVVLVPEAEYEAGRNAAIELKEAA
jgi:hypothetical protein